MQQFENKTAYIKEIFTSIQGEGPYVGQKQFFIRFSRCNLSCAFCDTDFKINSSEKYDVLSLVEEVKKSNCDIISLTGGEPLMEVEFLKEFLPLLKKENKTIYLETNGTLYVELKEIIEFIDIISMDIKIKSASKEENRFFQNDEFIKIAKENKKEIFVKIIFDDKITNFEIDSIIDIISSYDVEIILQPKMPLDYKIDFLDIYNRFYKKHKKTRLILQTHKFLNIL